MLFPNCKLLFCNGFPKSLVFGLKNRFINKYYSKCLVLTFYFCFNSAIPRIVAVGLRSGPLKEQLSQAPTRLRSSLLISVFHLYDFVKSCNLERIDSYYGCETTAQGACLTLSRAKYFANMYQTISMEIMKR